MIKKRVGFCISDVGRERDVREGGPLSPLSSSPPWRLELEGGGRARGERMLSTLGKCNFRVLCSHSHPFFSGLYMRHNIPPFEISEELKYGNSQKFYFVLVKVWSVDSF